MRVCFNCCPVFFAVPFRLVSFCRCCTYQVFVKEPHQRASLLQSFLTFAQLHGSSVILLPTTAPASPDVRPYLLLSWLKASELLYTCKDSLMVWCSRCKNSVTNITLRENRRGIPIQIGMDENGAEWTANGSETGTVQFTL